uniref:Uncharacterized protein n=1 Tax=Oryza rufipogon TaxID=4529 RepID=A0A0E0PME0_ORYRU
MSLQEMTTRSSLPDRLISFSTATPSSSPPLPTVAARLLVRWRLIGWLWGAGDAGEGSERDVPGGRSGGGAAANPRGFVNLLCKQLDHLGNARFDPALFRVDAYDNVLYLHADTASPLAWDIDHWFPAPIRNT